MKGPLLHPHRPDAFSLVELLVVMAIISVLMFLAIPAITGTVRGSQLTTAGNNLIEQLNLARQTAMTRNCEVEFRFYKVPDSGATVSSPPTTYRIYQSYSLDENGQQTNAITKPIFLPDGVTISSTSTYSSLLPASPSNPPYSVSGTAAGTSLGLYGPSSYNYMDFHFRANGSTDLNPNSSSTWFISLINEHDSSVGPTGLPNNFFTVQVDALSGHARSFRPN